MTKNEYWKELLEEFEGIVEGIEDSAEESWWKEVQHRGEVIEQTKRKCFPDTDSYRRIRDCPAFMFTQVTRELLADKTHPVTAYITAKELDLFPAANVSQAFVLITSNPKARLGQEVLCKTHLLVPTIDSFDEIPRFKTIERSDAIRSAKRWIRYIKNTIKSGLSNPNSKAGRPREDKKFITVFLHKESGLLSTSELTKRYKYKDKNSLYRAIRDGRKRFKGMKKRERELEIEQFCNIYCIETAVFRHLL